MSDVAQGPGWWRASDGRWYPPEALAQALGQVPAAGEPADLAEPAGVAGRPDLQQEHPTIGDLYGTHVTYGSQAAYGPPGQAVPPDFGYPPAHGGAGYWPPRGTPPARRSRTIGILLVLLGLAGVVWGIGELFAALALNSSPVYPHDEQVGAWILTTGILLASVVTMAIGVVSSRD